MMYDLPASPSAADIIRRSVDCHPSMFLEAIINQAMVNTDYAEQTLNTQAGKAAASMASTCFDVAELVRGYDVDGICSDCSSMVIALHIAGKLQCLPPHVRTQAVAAWEGEQTA